MDYVSQFRIEYPNLVGCLTDTAIKRYLRWVEAIYNCFAGFCDENNRNEAVLLAMAHYAQIENNPLQSSGGAVKQLKNRQDSVTFNTGEDPLNQGFELGTTLYGRLLKQMIENNYKGSRPLPQPSCDQYYY